MRPPSISSSSASSTRIQSPVAASMPVLRGAAKSPFHSSWMTRAPKLSAISMEPSTEPVSTMTISSTASRTLSRQRGRCSRSSRTIMQSDTRWGGLSFGALRLAIVRPIPVLPVVVGHPPIGGRPATLSYPIGTRSRTGSKARSGRIPRGSTSVGRSHFTT